MRDFVFDLRPQIRKGSVIAIWFENDIKSETESVFTIGRWDDLAINTTFKQMNLITFAINIPYCAKRKGTLVRPRSEHFMESLWPDRFNEVFDVRP